MSLLEKHKTIRRLEDVVVKELMERKGMSTSEARLKVVSECGGTRTFEDRVACLVGLLEKAKKRD